MPRGSLFPLKDYERFGSFGTGWKSLDKVEPNQCSFSLQPDPQALALQEEQQLCHECRVGKDCKGRQKTKTNSFFGYFIRFQNTGASKGSVCKRQLSHASLVLLQ